MKPTINKYIEQANQAKLYSCGTYRHKKGILPTITRTMKLTTDMHHSGLMVAGCSSSQRRDFTNHYLQQVIKGCERVIFITDKLNAPQQQKEFCNLMGLGRDTQDGIFFNEMSETLDAQPIMVGAKILVLSRSCNDSESYCNYGSVLMSLLKSIGQSKLGGKFKSSFVVVIDDDIIYSAKVTESIHDALNRIWGYDGCVGLLVSTSSPQNFKKAQREFSHYVVFSLPDPIEFIEFDIFKRNSLIEDEYGFICFNQFIPRDLRDLRCGYFNYTRSYIAEWAMNIKFSSNL